MKTIRVLKLGADITYDPNEFDTYGLENDHLRYIGPDKGKPIQPIGLKDYSFMFSNRKDLTSIDLSDWDMSKVTRMGYMFSDCTSLVDISSLSKWDVSNVEDMVCMFSCCESLSDIYSLSEWNVSNVKDMQHMFSHCDYLSDISSLKDWNLLSIQIMDKMFCDCSSITDIRCLDHWNVPKKDTKELFLNSTFLSNLNEILENKNNLTVPNLSSYYNKNEVINGIY